eukprot:gene32054-42773_t
MLGVAADLQHALAEQRQEFMEATDLSEIVAQMRQDVIDDMVARDLPPKAYAEQWDIDDLEERVRTVLGMELPLREWAAEEGIANEEIRDRLDEAANKRAAEREQLVSAGQMRGFEKNFLLQMVDMQWREHLVHLDHLRNVIGLRGYGQRDPLNEYKTEAFSLFEKLLIDLRTNVTRWLMTVEFSFEEPPPPPTPSTFEVHLDPLTGENEVQGFRPGGLLADQRKALPVSALPEGWQTTGRNHPCPCGSGNKFKHCHGGGNPHRSCHPLRARSASRPATVARRPRRVLCSVPLPLTWSHSGVLHRVTHWPDVQFERLYGTEWIALAPSAERASLKVQLQRMGQALSNRNFLVAVGAGVFLGVALGMEGGLRLYFYTFLWGLKASDIMVLSLLAIPTPIIAAIIAPRLAERFGVSRLARD